MYGSQGAEGGVGEGFQVVVVQGTGEESRLLFPSELIDIKLNNIDLVSSIHN